MGEALKTVAFVLAFLAGLGAAGFAVVAGIYFGMWTLPALGMDNSPADRLWLYTLWSLPPAGSLSILISPALAWKGAGAGRPCAAWPCPWRWSR